MWEGKVEELRAGGGGGEGWAAANLEKARQKVRDKEDNVRQLERSVKRLEEWVAWEAKVTEEVVHEVVEVEVEEKVEEKVKEEVEEKVVEEKVTGAGEWLRGFLGGQAWGHHGPAMGPRHPDWPPTPKP